MNQAMEKGGFRLFLSASQSDENVFLTINNLGNIDVLDRTGTRRREDHL